MRATTKPGFLDYVDLLSRGGTEDWKQLYAQAKTDPVMRGKIRLALEFVDPGIGETKALWTMLLEHLPPLPDDADGGTEQESPGRTAAVP